MKTTSVLAGGAVENEFAYRWQNGYGSFRKVAERSGAGVHPAGRIHRRRTGGVGDGARRWAGDARRTAHADRGPLPRLRRRRPVDSPDAPPFSARPVALPYMGIKRTAPRDWSRPGTSRRPRPNAFQTASGISSSRRRRRDVLPLRPTPSPIACNGRRGGGAMTCRLDAIVVRSFITNTLYTVQRTREHGR